MEIFGSAKFGQGLRLSTLPDAGTGQFIGGSITLPRTGVTLDTSGFVNGLTLDCFFGDDSATPHPWKLALSDGSALDPLSVFFDPATSTITATVCLVIVLPPPGGDLPPPGDLPGGGVFASTPVSGAGPHHLRASVQTNVDPFVLRLSVDGAAPVAVSGAVGDAFPGLTQAGTLSFSLQPVVNVVVNSPWLDQVAILDNYHTDAFTPASAQNAFPALAVAAPGPDFTDTTRTNSTTNDGTTVALAAPEFVCVDRAFSVNTGVTIAPPAGGAQQPPGKKGKEGKKDKDVTNCLVTTLVVPEAGIVEASMTTTDFADHTTTFSALGNPGLVGTVQSTFFTRAPKRLVRALERFAQTRPGKTPEKEAKRRLKDLRKVLKALDKVAKKSVATSLSVTAVDVVLEAPTTISTPGEAASLSIRVDGTESPLPVRLVLDGGTFVASGSPIVELTVAGAATVDFALGDLLPATETTIAAFVMGRNGHASSCRHVIPTWTSACSGATARTSSLAIRFAPTPTTPQA